MIPLSLAGPGRFRIAEIRAGHTLRHRLQDLGINEGDVIEVVATDGGPVFVRSGNSRIGLGRGMSSKILVIPDK